MVSIHIAHINNSDTWFTRYTMCMRLLETRRKLEPWPHIKLKTSSLHSTEYHYPETQNGKPKRNAKSDVKQ
uniref:Uncharacterized protein n=1 Tax=Tetraselmis sp. GSL018 TaxID=582737 RepID=A0A061RX86_9CHLO